MFSPVRVTLHGSAFISRLGRERFPICDDRFRRRALLTLGGSAAVRYGAVYLPPQVQGFCTRGRIRLCLPHRSISAVETPSNMPSERHRSNMQPSRRVLWAQIANILRHAGDYLRSMAIPALLGRCRLEMKTEHATAVLNRCAELLH